MPDVLGCQGGKRWARWDLDRLSLPINLYSPIYGKVRSPRSLDEQLDSQVHPHCRMI